MRHLSYGHQTISAEDIKAVVKALKSEYLTQGPLVEEFEQKIAAFTNAKYAVAVANATAALHICVLALDIKKGMEGITSPISFAASANCLLYCNLIPKFADIDPKTYNIDPKEIEKNLSLKTKVLIPVHFAGQAPQMNKISQIAKAKKLFVIEDAAQAIGSKYTDGTMVGNCKYSDMTVFSFHPVKNMTTGEGGVITTNNPELYERLKLFRSHGITKNPKYLSQNPGPWYYEMQELGFNYRLTDIQAALGISQLKRLNKFIAIRQKIISTYNKAFSSIPTLITPYQEKINYAAFHLYVLKIAFDKIGIGRKEFMEKLKAKGIGTQVHYIPIHLQPYYKKLGFKSGDFPIAEEYYEKALSIPLYPTLKKSDIAFVIKTITQLTT